MADGCVSNRGLEVIPEPATVRIGTLETPLDDANKELLGHVLGVLGIAQERVQVSENRIGIANQKTVRVVHRRPARGNTVELLGNRAIGCRIVVHVRASRRMRVYRC